MPKQQNEFLFFTSQFRNCKQLSRLEGFDGDVFKSLNSVMNSWFFESFSCWKFELKINIRFLEMMVWGPSGIGCRIINMGLDQRIDRRF